MTLPNERYRSLKQGTKLLEELCDPGKTPRVPSLIRDRARSILRHFPHDIDIDQLAENCPEVLDKTPNNDRIINKQSNR
jgi:hypothetical protein